ncbi:EAL domain-containing protein [Sphingomonas sp. TDK1]|uniref:EAL domain-containing protein n=1 Tax=Sphingomonas sp. TDK1 TaxID=453247 RepID=UPI0007D93A90|nr:EAL domain-containing protein [Sphingomonas sp. TDK1]OAN57549.1 hypothetical protein A7X12_06650 [Sphingomonas sp. TDK1]
MAVAGAKMLAGKVGRYFGGAKRRSVAVVLEQDASQQLVACAALVVIVRIDNLEMVRAAFGDVAATEVSDAVRAALQKRLGELPVPAGQGLVQSGAEFGFVVYVVPDAGTTARQLLHAQVDPWLADIGCHPIPTVGGDVHVALSWAFVDAELDPNAEEARHLLLLQARDQLPRRACGGGLHFFHADWVRLDMGAAAAGYAELIRGELQFAWEPVRSIDGGALLFMRAIAAVPGTVGQVIDREGNYRALERLGLVSAFDQVLIRYGVERLVRDEGEAVCVAVSAVSFRWSAWWNGVASHLATHRSLAERLFIAVDCDQFSVVPGGAVELADRLRSLGCKIVLLGFGGAQVGVASVLALQPDVITLDPFVVRIAKQGDRGKLLLRHVLALAESLAPCVVAEGIDMLGHAAVAAESGVSWGCGDYFGAPSWVGPGLMSGARSRPAPFPGSDRVGGGVR